MLHFKIGLSDTSESNLQKLCAEHDFIFMAISYQRHAPRRVREIVPS